MIVDPGPIAHNHEDDLEPSYWDAAWMFIYYGALILVLIILLVI